jgi:hypothetical protein
MKINKELLHVEIFSQSQKIFKVRIVFLENQKHEVGMKSNDRQERYRETFYFLCTYRPSP